MIYLLDTNICIYLIRKKPREVIEKLISHSAFDISVSSITVAELEYGVEKSEFPKKNREALEEFLLPLEVRQFDAVAARYYGSVRVKLEKTGRPIGSFDLLIAAHALSIGATVVTNNMREFSRVPDL